MKKNLLHLLIILFTATSCVHEPTSQSELTSQSGDKKDDTTFTIDDARSYFENNATELRNVDFRMNTTTTQTKRASENIIPQWDKAKSFQRNAISTIEVPLSGHATNSATQIRHSSTGKPHSFPVPATSQLIVQKKGDNPRMFVATLINNNNQNNEPNKVWSYTNTEGFNGYIIISALNGKILDGFEVTNGLWKRVSIGKKRDNYPDQHKVVGLRIGVSKVSTKSDSLPPLM